MKKLLMLLLLAFIATPCISTPAMTVVQKNMGYISINATESKEIAPNTANITFAIETTDIDSKRAAERNSQITSKVIAALKQELTSDKKSDIQTRNYNLRPNYKYNKNSDDRSIKNYTAINSIVVKTSDTSMVSKLIDTAIKNNVSNVSGVSMTIENQDQFATEIVNAALTKAKNQAKATAAALNQKVVGIKSLRVNVYQQGANGVRLYKAAALGSTAADTATPTPIEAGKVQLNASVDAEFYVK